MTGNVITLAEAVETGLWRLMCVPLEGAEFSEEIQRVLRKVGVVYLGDLVQMPREDLEELPGMTQELLDEMTDDLGELLDGYFREGTPAITALITKLFTEFAYDDCLVEAFDLFKSKSASLEEIEERSETRFRPDRPQDD